MVVGLGEGQIIKSYTHKGEIMQALFDLEGNSSVTITYHPPAGYYFVPTYSIAGDTIYYYCKVTATFDGELIWNNIRMSSVLQNMMDSTDMRVTRHELKMTLTNEDTISHTIDFMVTGMLVPSANYDDYVKEITGRMDREIWEKQAKALEEIKSLLKEITNLLKSR